MVDFREDEVAYPTMVRLSACIEAELAKSGLPAVCVSAPVPGPLAVMERCGQCDKEGGDCGGQAWVRFVTEYPSKSFPQPDQDGQCSGTMAYTLEVGIARCQPVGTTSQINGFQPPTVEQLLKATRLQMADKSVMRRAIQCCINEMDVSYVLGSNVPMQASGGCGGSVWEVTIWTE